MNKNSIKMSGMYSGTDHILEDTLRIVGSKNPALQDALLYCAIPRWFDIGMIDKLRQHAPHRTDLSPSEILREVQQRLSVSEYPFAKGYILHDRERSYLRLKLGTESPDLARSYSKVVVEYCDEVITRDGADKQREEACRWERLYHLLAIDEERGFVSFEDMFFEAKEKKQLTKSHSLVRLAEEQRNYLTKEHLFRLRELKGAGIFVGREKQIQQFLQMLGQEKVLRVMYLEGDKGVGKTKLLEMFWPRYCEQSNLSPFRPIPLIDFSELDNQRVSGVEYHIARVLGEESFQEYFARFKEYDEEREKQRKDRRLSDAGKLNQMRHVVRQSFLKCFAELVKDTTDRPVLLLLDAFENLEYGDVERWLLREFLPYLKDLNVLAVITGQPRDYAVDFGEVKDQVWHVMLSKFEAADTAKYFHEYFGDQEIADGEVAAKIHALASDGHPVLVALACELLGKKKDRAATLEMTPTDFEEYLFALIMEIGMIESQAISWMAHLHHGFDNDMLSYFSGLSRQESERILRRLSVLTFVKYRPISRECVLHDKVRELINRFKWSGEKGEKDRRALSQQAVDYYTQRLAMLQEEGSKAADVRVPERSEEEVLIAKRLFYGLDVSLNDTVKTLKEKAFRDALDDYRLGLCEMMLRVAKEYRDAFFPEKKFTEIDLLRARLLFAQERWMDAKSVLEKILERRGLPEGLPMELEAEVWSALLQLFFHTSELAETDIARRYPDTEERLLAIAHDRTFPKTMVADAWAILARLAAFVPDFNNMMKYYYASLAICEGNPQLRKTEAYNHISVGYGYRQQGEWEKAIEYYMKSLRICEEEGDIIGACHALRNLANAYRLQWNIKEAIARGEKALGMIKTIPGSRYDLGLTLNTLGMVYRDADLLYRMKDKQYGELAEKYFEQARVIFSQPLVEQGDRGIALVNINLGIMSRRLGDLDEGLRRLEDGRDRLRKLGEMGYLAEALDELGLVYMEMGKLRKAQDYLKESLQIALEYTDKYRFGSVVVDICKVHYLNSDYPGLENCAATWEEKLLEWGIQRYTYVWAKFNYLRGMGHWAAGHFLNGLRYLSAAAMAGFNATQLRPSRITPWINTWRFWKVTISSRKNWR